MQFGTITVISLLLPNPPSFLKPPHSLLPLPLFPPTPTCPTSPIPSSRPNLHPLTPPPDPHPSPPQRDIILILFLLLTPISLLIPISLPILFDLTLLVLGPPRRSCIVSLRAPRRVPCSSAATAQLGVGGLEVWVGRVVPVSERGGGVKGVGVGRMGARVSGEVSWVLRWPREGGVDVWMESREARMRGEHLGGRARSSG